MCYGTPLAIGLQSFRPVRPSQVSKELRLIHGEEFQTRTTTAELLGFAEALPGRDSGRLMRASREGHRPNFMWFGPFLRQRRTLKGRKRRAIKAPPFEKYRLSFSGSGGTSVANMVGLGSKELRLIHGEEFQTRTTTAELLGFAEALPGRDSGRLTRASREGHRPNFMLFGPFLRQRRTLKGRKRRAIKAPPFEKYRSERHGSDVCPLV
ncbi:unnamed protein product [Arctogadus glacialis]